MIAVYFYTISINLLGEEQTIEYTVHEIINGFITIQRNSREQTNPKQAYDNNPTRRL